MAYYSRFQACRGGTAKKWLKKAVYSLYCSEQALVFAARPSIINKSFVVNFFQIIINETVDNSVPYTRYGNFPTFVIANNKFAVTAVAIRSVLQILRKGIKVFFKMILKRVHLKTCAFALSKFTPAFPNIF